MQSAVPVPYAEATYGGEIAYGPWPPKDAAARFDPRFLLAVLKRHIRLFVAVAASVLLVVALATMLMPHKYRASVEVLIDPRKEKIASTEEVLSSLPAETNVVDTEVGVLNSPDLARRVVAALHLDRDPEFASLNEKDPRKRREDAAAALSKAMNAKRADVTSFLIDLSLESKSPTKAAQIANKFAELYLAQQVEAKQDATSTASRWLNGRLAELRQQVLQDDAAVQQYKIDNNLQSAAGQGLTEQELSSYNQIMSAARVQVAEDQARLETARAQLATGSKGDDVGEALASPVVQELRKQRAALSVNVAALQHDFKDGYPPLDRAKSQLADIDAQIQAEIRRTINNLEAKLRVSRQRESAVEANLNSAKGALTSNTRAMVRLNELERNAAASRTLYESYLNRYKEISSQQGLAQPDARIVSLAKPPTTASSPNVMRNAAAGLALALAAGGIAVALAELLRTGLHTSGDVTQSLRAKSLGSIPELKSVARNAANAIDHVVDQRHSAFPESFRSLRVSVLGMDPDRPVRTLAITSALPREGKSTTSICLARTAALQGWRVLLIDCDLRRPGVTGMFADTPRTGLLDVIFGDRSLADAVVRDSISGADLLLLPKTSAAGLDVNAAADRDIFGSEIFGRLIAEAKARYDLVILDTAPVLPVADTRVLAQKVDGVVCIARWKQTPRRAVAHALRILESLNANVIGVVLTRVDMTEQAATAYGDPEYFYRHYESYYASS
jgi:capsular exopolysaccharide synthesis family protein